MAFIWKRRNSFIYLNLIIRLFPNINHCHYPKIQPIVEKVCKKHNVKYKKFEGFSDALSSYYAHIAKLAKAKLEKVKLNSN